MQDSTHLWKTEKRQTHWQALPERGEENQTWNRDSRNGEVQRDKPDGTWPSCLFWDNSEDMHGPFLTMGMFYLCTFLFSKLRAADTEVHLMKKKKKLYVFISVYVHVMCASTVCSLYGVCVLYVCRAEWMYMYAPGSKARHCQFHVDSQLKAKGCFLCPSLCCWCVLLHLMLFDVFESDSLPLFYVYILLGRTASVMPFVNFLPVAYINKHTFVLCSPAEEESKDTRLTNGHEETPSMHHQCRAFSHIAVLSNCLLYSVLWVYLKHMASWVKCLPLYFFLYPCSFCICLSMWASIHQHGFSDMLLQLAAKGPNNRNINHNSVIQSEPCNWFDFVKLRTKTFSLGQFINFTN